MPVDDEHARMMAYARSADGWSRIAKAQAEIDAGLGIVADDAYFENLKKRRARKRSLAAPMRGATALRPPMFLGSAPTGLSVRGLKGLTPS